jgi:PadR family transcriptional regulator
VDPWLDQGSPVPDDERDRIALPQGALELLALRTLSGGALHGYAIAQAVQRQSREALRIEEGSLYPALHRMEHRGWIESEWGQTDSGRRAKFYALTPAGRKRLKAERKAWERMTTAVGLVLRGQGAEA